MTEWPLALSYCPSMQTVAHFGMRWTATAKRYPSLIPQDVISIHPPLPLSLLRGFEVVCGSFLCSVSGWCLVQYTLLSLGCLCYWMKRWVVGFHCTKTVYMNCLRPPNIIEEGLLLWLWCDGKFYYNFRWVDAGWWHYNGILQKLLRSRLDFTRTQRRTQHYLSCSTHDNSILCLRFLAFINGVWKPHLCRVFGDGTITSGCSCSDPTFLACKSHRFAGIFVLHASD